MIYVYRATLEFEAAIKVLEEHIEILNQNLLLMAEHKPENILKSSQSERTR